MYVTSTGGTARFPLKSKCYWEECRVYDENYEINMKKIQGCIHSLTDAFWMPHIPQRSWVVQGSNTYLKNMNHKHNENILNIIIRKN